MTTSMKICIAFETSNTKAKKNIFKFKWIQTTGTETYYEIPEDKQNPHDHHELFALPKVKNILKSMKTRGSFRTCVISLTPELKGIYFDAEEDVMFRDEYLQMTYSPAYVKTEFGGELAESRNTTELSSGKTKENKKDFKKIKDNFVLNNFDGKNVSVTLWLKKFESECMRCGVEEDMDKILILRLFLDGIAKEWFDSKLIILGLETDFQIWKNNCLDSFCETSWHKHREAYSFRYIGGSLVDYAFRKENLLLNLRNNFPTDILIDLIVTSLPNFLQDIIDRSNVTTFEKLLGELRKLEGSTKYENARNTKNGKMNKSAEQLPSLTKADKKEPCSICDKNGFPGRFHPEALCRLKNRRFNF
ncbi:uncharacterized protein LOC123322343 [Coccinella septempunctata]|uniref:uncharacterized protein LOC123322343 n=1 Tax=Coccinella septempunctata TaxID=41139 RepID=UPI001D06B31E|nr:uncharacterized protein LOC123322343 [Coccinella septempunctata]